MGWYQTRFLQGRKIIHVWEYKTVSNEASGMAENIVLRCRQPLYRPERSSPRENLSYSRIIIFPDNVHVCMYVSAVGKRIENIPRKIWIYIGRLTYQCFFINRLNTSISILWEWIILKGLSSFVVLYLPFCPQLLATNLRSLRNPTRDIIVNIFSAKYFVSARLIYLHKVEL